MEGIKERLDGILRYLVIGYPLMFLFIWIIRILFLSIDLGYLAPELVGFLGDFMFFFSKFYYGDIEIVSIGRFPFASLSTFGILVGARYIISGKTYQK